MREFSEWNQAIVLALLSCYQPASDEEVFDILNILDERLKHPNGAVVMGAARLFLQYTEVRRWSCCRRHVLTRVCRSIFRTCKETCSSVFGCVCVCVFSSETRVSLLYRGPCCLWRPRARPNWCVFACALLRISSLCSRC
jgi:hypothetical protein